MPDTTTNLETAFAGESQANRRYLAFARKADEDGLPQVARLFRAAAAAETVHAHAHLRVLGGVKDTAANLRTATAGENHEAVSMYPEFLRVAQDEGNKPAAASFRLALAVERIHHGLYSHALEAVEAGKDLPARELYVCPVCGNTVYDRPPDRCPICNAAGSTFTRVD